MSSKRPEPPHRRTSKTLNGDDASESKKEISEVSSDHEKKDASGRPSDSDRESSETAKKDTPEFGKKASTDPQRTPSSRPLRSDIILLTCISIMLVWPWILFGTIWALKGVKMPNRTAKLVTEHPHGTNFIVTFIGTVISMIVSILFSLSIIRFAQEWVTKNNPVEVFHVTVLSALRHQSWPGWGVKDIGPLLKNQRWLAAILVGVCFGTFTFVTSSTTSLITPVPFNRSATLTGTELNFSSTAADCLDWFNANPIPNNCDWQTFNGLDYTNCLGENQLVDVLESGRGNILSLLPNNTQSLTLSQLGGVGGLHFLGPVRGVLPIGPNGVPAFDTLHASPFSDPKTRAAMISYNYTLDYQGLFSKVSCIYDAQSPIQVAPLVTGSNVAVYYNATCDEGVNILSELGVISLDSPNSENALVFWACKSPPNATPPSYTIYLQGLGISTGYPTVIGNITCDVSPIQPAVFPVRYLSIPGIFSAGEQIALAANVTFPDLVDRSLAALGGDIAESQNFQANLVAESVITLGVKSFGLQPYNKDPQYLRLFEAMIQGILEYKATYSRLIYSTVPNPPASCIRTMSGTLSYEVIGWSTSFEHIGLLMPLTLVTLAALVIVIAAMTMVDRAGERLDPTDARTLIYAEPTTEGDPASIWEDKVTYNPANFA